MATPSLRPLSVGEILDAGIKVCTRHWKALALCVLIPVLPLAILQVLILTSVDSEALELLPEGETATVDDFSTDVWVTLIVTYGFSLIMFVAVNTVCFKAVADAWLGAKPTPGRSIRFGLKSAPRIILLSLVWFPVMLLAMIPCGIPAVWLGTVWSLSLAAVMFERAGAFKALGRSYGLIQNRFWATLLLILVSFLLVSILGGIVSSIPSVFVEVLASENELALAVATIVGMVLSSVLTYPYSAAVLTILYFDQRVRKEGFDVQMLAQGLGEQFDPNAAIPAPLQPAPYGGPPPQAWQPQGQYGGWNAPSYQSAPLRWGPGAQTPPAAPADGRPPEDSPWMRPAPGGWAPPAQDGPAGPPPTWAPPSGPGGSTPSSDPGPASEAARWGRPSEPAAPPSDPGLSSGSPLADEPSSHPPDPLPPSEEPAPPAARWGGSSPFGESPWEDKGTDEEPPKRDKDRADWQPPEDPRGPGGL